LSNRPYAKEMTLSYMSISDSFYLSLCRSYTKIYYNFILYSRKLIFERNAHVRRR
jgi:hypothetical protein